MGFYCYNWFSVNIPDKSFVSFKQSKLPIYINVCHCCDTEIKFLTKTNFNIIFIYVRKTYIFYIYIQLFLCYNVKNLVCI